jgi:hypothetical protein
MKYILAITAAAFLVAGSAEPSFAQQKKGFATQTTQGNSGKTAKAGATNQGLKTVTGPKGQVKQGNTTCNNCTQDLPGRNR